MIASLPRLASLLLLSALAATAGTAVAKDPRGQVGRPEMGRPEPGNQGRGGVERMDGARGGNRHDRGQDHRELSDAVRRVERSTGGQVLSAERVPFDGRDVNRVKVIDSSGRVRVYMDDPPRASRKARESVPATPPPAE